MNMLLRFPVSLIAIAVEMLVGNRMRQFCLSKRTWGLWVSVTRKGQPKMLPDKTRCFRG
ncbi:hypothetical protein QF049_005348 [Paenibacillus sp. W4I10]|uniref:hypothetical protein n=1 Tax=Paenibacillus sp. W4I10 TaxID=3042298 RepID=UPI00277FDBCF|nr:hypothetical protein [Paenibacillus sp. W4I10]MDQ0724087.1 hypothetical protein [Paenibacillus sp. W4I10]